MNLQAIVDRALRGETTSIEAKAVSLAAGRLEPHPESIAQELAGLANSAGGHLVLGVDSERHRLTGVRSDELQDIIKRLDAILFDAIRPPMYFSELEFGTVVDQDGNPFDVIVIAVPKSLFVHDVNGVTWIRLGTSKRRMDADARARLAMQRSHSKLMHFDELPVSQCGVSNLDESLIGTLLASSQAADLASLRLLAVRDGMPVPVVTAILLLTKDPSFWLRGAYVQAEVFRGVHRDPSNQVDFKRLDGPVDQQILEALSFCMRHSNVGMLKDPARKDLPAYDELAVYEALANAVVHRDYSMSGSAIVVSLFSDRLEITSPGSLPNTLTLETMRAAPMARNDLLVGLLARYYKTRRFGEERSLIESRHFGVRQILERSQKLSGREPVYELIEMLAVKLTIFPANGAHPEDIE